MKRRCAIILSFTVALNLFVSAYGADKISADSKAETKKTSIEDIKKMNSGLENAIKVAKSKFEIPGDYKDFSSDIEGNSNNPLYRLNWRKTASGNEGDGESINVSVDSKGNIISFYCYKGEDKAKKDVNPISEEEALENAKKFVYYVGMDIAQEVSFDKKGGYNDDMGSSYNFNFFRQHNGIPFKENSVNVSIDAKTGEVQRYERNWNLEVEFPDSKNAISLEEAGKKYRENIGLRLRYRLKWDKDENGSTYLVYSPDTDNNNAGINALTGEKVDNSLNGLVFSDAKLADGFTTGALMHNVEKEEVKLSPNEIKEVESVQKLASVEDAMAKLKGIKEFDLDDTCKVQNFHYNSNSRGKKKEYILNMNISKALSKDTAEAKEADTQERLKSINVSMNAETNEVLSFYSYDYKGIESKEKKFTQEQTKAMAQEFLKKYEPEKFSQMEYKKRANIDELLKYGYERNNSISFIRKVNDIPMDENGADIQYDLSSGKLTRYSMNWGDYDFAGSEGVIGLDAAYNSFFEKCGLKLCYMTQTTMEERMGRDSSGPKKALLVYMPSAEKPRAVDAKKGVLLMDDGEEYLDREKSFDDIDNHWAQKQIKGLLEKGFLIPEKSFLPDSMITQEYLVAILARIKGRPMVAKVEDLKGEGFAEYYKQVAREDILDESEKNPGSFVNRETAAKYLIRAKGYKKYAEIEGLYKCDFKDKDEIDNKLLGYVAITGAMKIASGNENGAFMPKKNLTRAEAVVMVYNLLKVLYR